MGVLLGVQRRRGHLGVAVRDFSLVGRLETKKLSRFGVIDSRCSRTPWVTREGNGCVEVGTKNLFCIDSFWEP